MRTVTCFWTVGYSKGAHEGRVRSCRERDIDRVYSEVVARGLPLPGSGEEPEVVIVRRPYSHAKPCEHNSLHRCLACARRLASVKARIKYKERRDQNQPATAT